MRLTVSWASVVCSVDMTKCPVSAAESAARTVSSSRISPTRMTSGSWRMAARRAEPKSAVSSPTSRWLIIASLSCVDHLDRILDGHHVDLAARLIRSIIAGERRRLAAAGRSGDEHEPARLEGELADGRRQAEVLERDGTQADPPEDDAHAAPAAEGVDAEAPDSGQREGEVDLVRPPEVLDQVGAKHLDQHALGVGRRQHRRLHHAQRAVDPDPRRRADLAVQVRPQQLDEGTEVGLDARFEAHPGAIDRGCGLLEDGRTAGVWDDRGVRVAGPHAARPACRKTPPEDRRNTHEEQS